MKLFLLFNFTNILSTFDLNCKNNMVHYWGQNSYGAGHLDEPKKWEKDLSHYCSPESTTGSDIFIVSFLNVFNAGNGKLPQTNFANHCDTFFNETEANYVRYCPKIGQDIQYCQSNKKLVLLSLGGAIGSTGFQNAQEAESFALTIWNMFLGGKHKYRPFDNAIFDGIDLDIENGSSDYYDLFVTKLRSLFSTDNSKKYYIGAAPQCEFPDRLLKIALNNSWIDMVFIQFYNNWCGVQNYDNKWAWNFPTWENWAKTISINKNVKLFLGVPASSSAAGSGYVNADRLKKIIADLIKSDIFGGVMMWDSSQAENNLNESGKSYSKVIKEFLNQNNKCSNQYLMNSSKAVYSYKTPQYLSQPQVDDKNLSLIEGEPCDSNFSPICKGSSIIVCDKSK